MKKKVLYGIFMALLAVVSMGSLQSCKDDLSGIEEQHNFDVAYLKTYVDKLIADQKADMDACKKELQSMIDTKVSKEEFLSTLKDYVTLDMLKAELAKLKDYSEDIDGINNRLGVIEGEIAGINELISGLDSKYALKSDVTKLEENLNTLKEQVAAKADTTEISRLDKDVAELWAAHYANQEYTTQLYNLFNDRVAEVDEFIADIYQRIELNEQEMTWIQNQVSDLQEEMEALRDQMNLQDEELWQAIENNQEYMTMMFNVLGDQMEELNEKVDKLSGIYDRLNKLITNILVQGSYNPLFGTFSLPIGVRSNMLFNWYGHNDGMTFSFPSSSKGQAYDGRPSDLTDEDIMYLNPERFEIKNGAYLTDGNLGRVYMTINPVGVDFSGATFTLEKSNGEPLPYELKPIKKSTETMSFGYSRNAENGFYEADVKMPATAEAIHATKIDIEPGLKSAVKGILKDRSKRSAINLLKAVYSEMSGFLPAYALRADWTSQDGNGSLKNYAVLSQYELAVTTARPLSYSFYEGQGSLTDRRLPHVGSLENLLRDIINKDDFKFDLKTSFKVKDFTIEFSDMTFDFNVDINYDGTIQVEIPSINVYDNDGNLIGHTEAGKKADVTTESLEGFIESIENALDDAINNEEDGLAKQINDQIREVLVAEIQNSVDEMLADLQSQIDQMLTDLEGEINDQLGDMIDKINNELKDKAGTVLDRVDKFVDLYNRVADKINNFLTHPNNYLQPVLFYHTKNGGVGIMSTSLTDPTIFTKGGGNAITLIASSYSAEIVAPAYRKYVAVTNVYNGTTKLNRDQYDIKGINAESQMLNKVLSGSQKRVPLATSKLKSGLTYEIVYQGVDYEGKTSAQKFYIKVK